MTLISFFVGFCVGVICVILGGMLAIANSAKLSVKEQWMWQDVESRLDEVERRPVIR